MTMSKNRAIAIIQARMSSSRLPGKVLEPLAGKPMIWHIVQRARLCTGITDVVVATSTENTDDPLVHFCELHDIRCHRGSLQNVLSRYLEILEVDSYNYFVRLTGDCPLIDPEFIDRQLSALHVSGGDFVCLDTPLPIFSGQGAQSVRSLKYIATKSQHPDDFEHVGSRYMAENPEQFKIVGIKVPQSFGNTPWRLMVDQRADLEMMRRLYGALWQGEPFSLKDALEWLERHPQVTLQNEGVEDSAINRELSVRRRAWRNCVDQYFDWNQIACETSDSSKVS